MPLVPSVRRLPSNRGHPGGYRSDPVNGCRVGRADLRGNGASVRSVHDFYTRGLLRWLVLIEGDRVGQAGCALGVKRCIGGCFRLACGVGTRTGVLCRSGGGCAGRVARGAGGWRRTKGSEPRVEEVAWRIWWEKVGRWQALATAPLRFRFKNRGHPPHQENRTKGRES